ncbi:MAG: class I SAM-dependent methyltransferase [Victivallales bacterium]
MRNNNAEDTAKEIFNNDEHVSNYEMKTKKANWLGPEIMLGLAFRHINGGEKILDLGIGSGLCSELFHKAGLIIFGMDFSKKMLDMCQRKKFAADLKKYDLRETPYPYADDSMDHAVCGGVMHILSDIDPIFNEVSRITRSGGIFTFCSMDMDRQKTMSVKTTAGNAVVFGHGIKEIELLLEKHCFKLINSISFEIDNHDLLRHFTAYAVRNIK